MEEVDHFGSIYAFALSGRECDVFVSHTQSAASLALGASLGFQPALNLSIHGQYP